MINNNHFTTTSDRARWEFILYVVMRIAVVGSIWNYTYLKTLFSFLLTFRTNLVSYIVPLLEVLAVIVPILLGVAFMTIIERKVLAAMQRRVGPNTVGAYGVLQPLKRAD